MTDPIPPEAPQDVDWPEDFAHENGRYWNACIHCGRHFKGHKRRVTCKQCSVSPEAPLKERPVSQPAAAIIQRVCELDYTPPEDFPDDMVMCTTGELALIIEEELAEIVDTALLTKWRKQGFPRTPQMPEAPLENVERLVVELVPPRDRSRLMPQIDHLMLTVSAYGEARVLAERERILSELSQMEQPTPDYDEEEGYTEGVDPR